ncbi:MAG: hypothetical protein C0412_03595 [Flavobacterium sp.]|nr:hypothetical protein [Flavobacterium sp.]
MNKNKIYFVLAGITIAGLFLRLHGIRWGLMNDKYFHASTAHPDEDRVLTHIREMKPDKLAFYATSNDFFGRGVLQTYITAIGIKVSSLFNIVHISDNFNYYKQYPEELTKLYLVGRVIVAIMGTLTILVIFFIGKVAYNETVGIISALGTAILPLHVAFSHYLTTDVPVTFWFSLLFLLSVMLSKNSTYKLCFIAGLVMGFTVSTKINHLQGVILPIVACILANNNKSKTIFLRSVLTILGGIILGTFLTNPYSILKFNLFLTNVISLNKGAYLTSEYTPMHSGSPTWFFYLIAAPYYALGFPLLVLYILGFVWAVKKRKKPDLLILLWFVSYYIVLFQVEWRLTRWIISLTPLFVLLAARFIFEFYQLCNKKMKWLTLCITLSAGVYTFLYSFGYVSLMAGVDTRDSSSKWIEENMPNRAKIGIQDKPFYGESSILQMYYWYKRTEPFFKDMPEYEIVPLYDSLEKLESTKPDYLIFTDIRYDPRLNHKDKYLLNVSPFTREVFFGDKYMEIKTFSRKVSFWNFPIKILDFAPLDWRWVSPTIKIFKRK